MIRHTHSIILAALLMAGAMLTSACSSDEAVIDDKATPSESVVKFTATLAPKGDNGSTTRAITTGTVSGNEVLNVAWVENEKIAVYYQKIDDSYATATATVTAVTDGKATISATLESAKNNSMVKFVYPATLANVTGDDIDENKLRNNQLGTIDDISANFDAATGSGTLVTDGTSCGTSGTVSLTNQCSICKFNIVVPDATSDATHYDVSIAFAGGVTYSLSKIPEYKMNSFYVAMLPVTTATTATITAQEYKSTTPLKNYSTSISGVTLAAEKFYRNIKIIFPITITGSRSSTLTIPDGGTCTLHDANISVSTGPGIICKGDAKIILEGDNTVITTADENPAIQAGGDNLHPKTLTISGSGKLTATGGKHGAGIGSGYNKTCGDITITSGDVMANGGSKGAGIGSGYYQSSCGNILISGGKVTATGGLEAAGIGSGSDSGSGSTNSCGNITIANTVTLVTATKGSNAPYSIGKGYNSSATGTITIGGTDYSTGITDNSYTYQP